MANWYVVQVSTGFEKRVKLFLETRYLAGLTPQIKEINIPIRKDNLMPSYIFVKADNLSASHFRGAPCNCNIIGTISEKEVLKWTGQPFKEIDTGDQVVIMEGPLAGKVGRVEISKGARSNVILGGMRLNVENKLLRVVN